MPMVAASKEDPPWSVFPPSAGLLAHVLSLLPTFHDIAM